MTTFGDTYANSSYAKSLNAQVAVVGDGAAADPSAVLDLHSTTKGILFPRLTTAEMHAVASPAIGLAIYNTTEDAFYYWTGVWSPVISQSLATLVVGGGSLDPSAILQVNSTVGGFALPRLTQAQRDSIPSPIKGLEVFVDDPSSAVNNSVSYYNGSAWVAGVRAYGNNILLGEGAGALLAAGSADSIYIGNGAGQHMTTGQGNIMMGNSATAFPSVVDSDNVMIGASLNPHGGVFNTYIGHASGGTAGINKTSIGHQAFSDNDNQVMVGNANIVEVVPNAAAIVSLGTSSNPWDNVVSKRLTFPTAGAITLPTGSATALTIGGGSTLATFDTLNTITKFQAPTLANRADTAPTYITTGLTPYQMTPQEHSTLMMLISPSSVSNVAKLPDIPSINPINRPGWRISIHNRGASERNLAITDFAGLPICSIGPASMASISLVSGVWSVEKNEINNRITVANAGGDFTTITAAMAYLNSLSLSPSNTYVVNVSPGLYIEPPINMISYVGIVGGGNNSTILAAFAPGPYIIKGCIGSYIQDITLLGAGVGGTVAGIDMSNDVLPGFIVELFLVSNCIISNCTTLIWAHDTLPSHMTNLSVVETLLSGPFTVGVSAESTHDAVALTMLNVVINSASGQEDTMVRVVGAYTTLHEGMMSCKGLGNERGLYVAKGASVVVFSALFDGCNMSLYVPSTDSDIPNISISQFVSSHSTVDVNIQNPLTMGSITGSFTLEKTIILSNNIAVGFQDPVHSGQVRVGQITSGDVFGTLANVSQLYNATPTMGLIKGGLLSQTSPNTLKLAVSQGFGYLQSTGYNTAGTGVQLERIMWDDTFVSLPSNSTVYVYYSSRRTLTCSVAYPNQNSKILLGRVSTIGTLAATFTIDVSAVVVDASVASKYLVFYPPGVDGYFLWLNVDGVAPAPVVYGLTPLGLVVATGTAPAALATAIAAAINAALPSFFSATALGAVVTVVDLNPGSTYQPINPCEGFTFVRTVVGSPTTTDINTITINQADVGGNTGGTWFYIYSPLQNLSGIKGTYVWIDISDMPYQYKDPQPDAQYTAIKVSILSNSSANDIALAIALAVNASGLFHASASGNVATVVASTIGAVYAAAHCDGIMGAIMATTVAGTGSFEFVEPSRIDANHNANTVNTYMRDVMGVKFVSGCIATVVAPAQFTVANGIFYYAETKYMPPASANPAVFAQYYATTSTTWNRTTGLTNVLYNVYNDLTTYTLAPITAGWYVAHSLYVVGNASQYMVVIAQSQYATLPEAVNATLPRPPANFSDGIALVASLIAQQGFGIVESVDRRSVINALVPGQDGVSVHGQLSGLSADDHHQYLLVNGTRAMGGNLNMGGNNINNLGTANGVTIELHHSRHIPGGADALPTAAPPAPISSSSANAEGSATSFARSDHQHAIDSTILTNVYGGNVSLTSPGGTVVALANGGFKVDGAESTLNLPTTSDGLGLSTTTFLGSANINGSSQFVATGNSASIKVDGVARVVASAEVSIKDATSVNRFATSGTATAVYGGAGVADRFYVAPGIAHVDVGGAQVFNSSFAGGFARLLSPDGLTAVETANGLGVKINGYRLPQTVGSAGKSLISDGTNTSFGIPTKLMAPDGNSYLQCANGGISYISNNSTGLSVFSSSILGPGGGVTFAYSPSQTAALTLNDFGSTSLSSNFDMLFTCVGNVRINGYALPHSLGSAGQVLTSDGGNSSSWQTIATFPTMTAPIIYGGTTATSTLTLQSTSGSGTTDSILFKVGNNGSINPMNITHAGVVIPAFSVAGLVHNSGAGLLSSSLLVDADVSAGAAIVDTKLATLSTAGKVANSATTATSANSLNTIVARDASGNFAANVITADLDSAAALSIAGTASTSLSLGRNAVGFTGITLPKFTTNGLVHNDAAGLLSTSLIVNGDVSATAAIVDTKLATIATVGKVANTATTATTLSTPNTIVLRDGAGAIVLGAITTPTVIGGSAATSTLTLQSTSGVGTTDAINFKIGNNGATTAMTVAAAGITLGSLAAVGVVHSSVAGLLSTSLIVDADVSATAAIADTKLATISTAGKVANSATTATSANSLNTIVARDSSGNFTAGALNLGSVQTSSLDSAAVLAIANANATSLIIGRNAVGFTGITLPKFTTAGIVHNDATGLLSTSLIVDADVSAAAAIVDTKLATIATAGKVANTATTATASNVGSTIVARDVSGNFAAGAITATAVDSAAALAIANTVATSLTLGRNNAGFTGITLAKFTTVGIVHNSATGLLSTSLIVDADVSATAAIVDTKLATISTAGKVANSATTATSANSLNTIVARDSSGNFTAGAINLGSVQTSSLDSAAILAIANANATSLIIGRNAVGFTGITLAKFTAAGVVHNDATGLLSTSLIVDADVSATAAIADTKLATISTAGKVVNSATTATSANVGSAIVARDGSGNFAAAGITAPTLLGGAAASSALTLQSTSGVGTTDSINFAVGNNGATTAMTISSAGLVSLNTLDKITNGALNIGTATANSIILGRNSGLFTGVFLPKFTTNGLVHNSATGLLSTSLIVDADVDPAAAIADTKLATISTAGKVANSATTATSSNSLNTIVARDSSGNFTAGAINLGSVQTSSLDSAAILAIANANATSLIIGRNAVGFTGITLPKFTTAGIVHNDATGLLSTSLIVDADVSATAAIVDTKLATISTALKVSNSATTATASNTASTIVARDGSGNFSANTMTLNSLNTPSFDFAGAMFVGGTLATSLSLGRNNAGFTGITLAKFTTAGIVHNDATGLLSTSLIVDADVDPAAAIADTKLATLSTAGKVANSATTATASNVLNSIVARDSSGNFTAGALNLGSVQTSSLDSAAVLAIANTAATSLILGRVGIASVTVPSLATVGIVHNSAAGLLSTSLIVNGDISATAAIVDTKLATIATVGKVANTATTATNLNTASAIVARDGSGNFVAGTITATLSTTVVDSAAALSIAGTTATSLTLGRVGITSVAVPSLVAVGIVHNDATGLLSTSLIVNGDISAAAAIVDTKLATIATVGKVANTATTATASNTVSAIVARDGSGNFVAGTITATAFSSPTVDAAGVVISIGGTTATSVSLGRVGIGITLTNLTAVGIVHNSAAGLLSTSLIVNADVDPAAAIADSKLATISTAGKVANTATTATASNTASAIVARDGSGNFAANTITLNTLSTPSLDFAGAMSVGGTLATSLSLGRNSGLFTGITLPKFTVAGIVHNDATGLLSTSLIVDADVSAGAAIADSKLATISTAGKVANSATTATASNTASAIVARDGSGNFAAVGITLSNVDSLAALAIGGTTATSLSLGRVGITSVAVPSLATVGIVHNSVAGLLSTSLIVNADVDPAAAIVDSKLATIATAGKVANTATTATALNTASAIVARDGSGNFVAGTITATLSTAVIDSAAALAIGGTTATSLSLGRVGITSVAVPSLATVGIVHNSAAGLLSTSLIVNADVDPAAAIADSKLATISTAGKVANSATTATASNTASAIVARDGSGNFAANVITAPTHIGGAAAASTLTLQSTSGVGTTDSIVFKVGNAGATTVATFATSGITVPAFSVAGLVHNSVAGLLSSSLLVDADVAAGAAILDTKLATLATAGKVANSATTATASNVGSTIVLRDAGGNFSAGTITASFATNNLDTAAAATLTIGGVNATSLVLGSVGIASVFVPKLATVGIVHNTAAGLLSTSLIVDADVSATAAIADTKLATISTVGKVANSATTATALNTASAIVARDAGGAFAAGIITAPSLVGGAAAASTLTLQSTSGVGTTDSILFKVGNAGATTVATFATSGITVSAFSVAGLVHNSVAGLLSTSLLVDADVAVGAAIADTKLATLTTAGKVANSATTATTSNVGSTIVLRDAGGNFSAGTITASFATNNLDTAAAATLTIGGVNATSLVLGSVGIASVVIPKLATLGIVHNTAAGVLSTSLIVDADVAVGAAILDTKLATISTAGKVANSATTATALNTASAIVTRDGSGNFAAGTITATLSTTTIDSAAALAIGGTTATSLSLGRNNAGFTGITLPKFTIVGIVHNDATGLLSTSLVGNADVSATAAIADTKLATISTAGKVANSATTATDVNTVSTIVARDGSGNFSAGIITSGFINGGTTATSNLTLQSTSGAGTSDSIAMRVGNSGLTLAMNIVGGVSPNLGQISFPVNIASSSAITGAVIITGGIGISGATYSGGGSYVGVNGFDSQSFSALNIASTNATSLSLGRNGGGFTGITVPAFTVAGLVHNSVAGLLSSSLLIDADVAAGAAIADTKLGLIATPLKVSNSATTATSANTALAIVSRNAAGAFTGGTITGSTLVSPTVIGGTAGGAALRLQSTSGTGSTDSISMNVGANGATMAMQVNGGAVAATLGQVSFLANIAAVSTATGTVIITGGLGISGDEYVGGKLYTVNGVDVSSATTFNVGTVNATSIALGSNVTINVSVPRLNAVGVVHNDASGNLSTSLIVNADVDPAAAIADSKLATIATAGKVANTATTATALNTASAIVARDGAGAFAAGIITAPSVVGGAAAGATLTLQSTSNGAALNDSILFKVGNAGAITGLAIGSSGIVKISNAYSMPTTAGSSNYILSTDGAGVASWSVLGKLGAPTIISGAGGGLPAAALLGGTIVFTFGGVASSYATDTGANIQAAYGAFVANQTFQCILINNGGASRTITGGVGVTIILATVVAVGAAKILYFTNGASTGLWTVAS